MFMDNIIWKYIPDTDNKYQVSNTFLVRNSITKQNIGRFTYSGSFHGRLLVNGRIVNIPIITLVYSLFVGPIPPGFRAYIKDKVAFNNKSWRDSTNLILKKIRENEKSIGDIVNKQYKVIGFDNKDHHTRYILECLKCHDIIVRSHSKNYSGLFLCSCNPKKIKIYTDNKRIYGIYLGMKQRCYNKNNASYNSYGGKGIFVCSYWLNDFLHFKNWWYSLDKNDNNKYSIDRIDPRYEYAPYNCQLISRSDNSAKKSIDSKRTEEQLIKDTYSFNKKKQEWIFSMKELGYSEEELI